MRNEAARVPDFNSFVSDPGQEFKTIYDVRVQEDGSIVLIPSGKENVKALINSYKEQTDMFYILKQLELGDTSVLSNKQALYGDFTTQPNDLRSAMQTLIDGEKAFYQLPLDLRQKFDNDYRKWLVSSGSPEWYSKMNVAKPAPAQEESKDKESKPAESEVKK